MFHVIDFAVAQSFEHELAVVSKATQSIGYLLLLSLTEAGAGAADATLVPADPSPPESVDDFRQGHPALAEMAIVFGQAADAGSVSHSQRADASPASLTPGKHYRRMESPVWLGAMAGRVATARLRP